MDAQVANIHLLDPAMINVQDIRELVPFLHRPDTGITDSTPLPDSMISRAGRKIGLNPTYEAAWIDDRQTKLAVRITNPGETPQEFAWKILSDHPTGLTGVGRMADASNNTVHLLQKALEKKPVVSGNLAWNPI